MRRVLIILILMLTGCASRDRIKEPEIKKELPLWHVLQYKLPGQKSLIYEDKWYRYVVEFDYFVKGQFDNTSMLQGGCPIGEANYTVTDKEAKTIIRTQTLSQVPCEPCHRR